MVFGFPNFKSLFTFHESKEYLSTGFSVVKYVSPNSSPHRALKNPKRDFEVPREKLSAQESMPD